MNTNQDKYFLGYEDLEVHELMLNDRPRVDMYYKAIMENKKLFKDKVVIDVGAGTGILSAFCAMAGARLVFAVEASNLAKIALEVMEENKLTSVVKVVHSKIEDFEYLEKVDILVSEWMGFYLLHEGMLDSVLYARDKFLKPEGVMFPSETIIYLAPCAVPSHFDYWQNVNGVNMSRFAEKLRIQKSAKPEIIQVCPNDLLHSGIVFHWMNLKEVSSQELNEITFKDVVAAQNSGTHQGFCIWFDCIFPGGNTVLSTSPNSPETHWKQCIIVLPENLCEKFEQDSPIAFQIIMRRNETDHRKYNLEVKLLDPEKEVHPIPCACHMTKCILTKAHLLTINKN